jgi:hypothetical protein
MSILDAIIGSTSESSVWSYLVLGVDLLPTSSMSNLDKSITRASVVCADFAGPGMEGRMLKSLSQLFNIYRSVIDRR